jgi:hypothetical protein
VEIDDAAKDGHDRLDMTGLSKTARLAGLRIAAAADGLVAAAASLVMIADAAFGGYSMVHRWGYGALIAADIGLLMALIAYRLTIGRRTAARVRLMRWFAAVRPA